MERKLTALLLALAMMLTMVPMITVAEPNDTQVLSADFSATAAVESGFAVPSGEGFFTVDLPEGAFESDTALTISSAGVLPEGIVAPGFFINDKAKPGEHVDLSVPATLMYWQPEPLPEGVAIVKYSDDGTSYEPVPCYSIKSSLGYGIFAEVDSFSGYGMGKVTQAQIDNMADRLSKEGFVWRLEAEEQYRYNNYQNSESVDLNFFIRADSKRTAEVNDGDNDVPLTYTGMFDINTFAIAEEKAKVGKQEVPLPIQLRVADNSFKLRIIPKFKKIENTKDEAWKQYEEMVNEANERTKKEGGFHIVPLVPPAFRKVFDGYVGWGTAHLRIAGSVVALVGESDSAQGREFIDIPVTVRIKGAVATVRFTYPGMGSIEMKGRYYGMGVGEANVAATPKDPAMSYAPGKAEKRPETVDAPASDIKDISETDSGWKSGDFEIVPLVPKAPIVNPSAESASAGGTSSGGSPDVATPEDIYKLFDEMIALDLQAQQQMNKQR